jgi:hypothetical protein
MLQSGGEAASIGQQCPGNEVEAALHSMAPTVRSSISARAESLTAFPISPAYLGSAAAEELRQPDTRTAGAVMGAELSSGCSSSIGWLSSGPTLEWQRRRKPRNDAAVQRAAACPQAGTIAHGTARQWWCGRRWDGEQARKGGLPSTTFSLVQSILSPATPRIAEGRPPTARETPDDDIAY